MRALKIATNIDLASPHSCYHFPLAGTQLRPRAYTQLLNATQLGTLVLRHVLGTTANNSVCGNYDGLFTMGPYH